MNKAKMTFRFDHPNETSRMEPEREAPRKPEATPSVQEGWEDPFGTSASSWSDPLISSNFSEDPTERVPFIDHDMTRPPTSSRWKLFGSVASALVTGGLFGYMVLLLFHGSTNVEAPALPGGTSVSVMANADNTTLSDPVNHSGSTPVIQAKVDPQTYYMLQYGVFSTPEGAMKAKDELNKVGIAAGSDSADQNRVYAGISADREQAKLLSNQLKTQGVELYVRTLQLPGMEKAAYGGQGDTLNTFFSLSSSLIHQLCSLSASLLGEGQPQAISSVDMKELNELHQQWTQHVGMLPAGLPQDGQVKINAMEKAMNSAVSALGEYNKYLAKEHAWEVQTNAMEYVLQEKELIQFMKQ